MKTKFENINDVVNNNLCMGCGACAAVCPSEAISLREETEIGIRPGIDFGACDSCGLCLKVCPGMGITHKEFNGSFVPELARSWGPVLEVWQGYAKEEQIRFSGSSGGVVTALALFALENQGIGGVLHTSASCDSPLKNVPVFSRNKKELLSAAGSRYSPAAPCEKIKLAQQSDKGCLFIGKSCDIQAVEKLKAVRESLSDKIKLTIGIFCAGTPAAKGTMELLDSMQVKAADVSGIRYRGKGWPGKIEVQINGDVTGVRELEYEKGWGAFLVNHIQPRCLICPDTTAELADISCGDAWHINTSLQNPGYSLILVRTRAGRDFFYKAIEAGYLKATEVEPSVLPRAQRSLFVKRASVWGRLLALNLTGRAAPRYSGFHLFANWLKLPVVKKMKTFSAMLRRRVPAGRNTR